jgi:hypothetical protein
MFAPRCADGSMETDLFQDGILCLRRIEIDQPRGFTIVFLWTRSNEDALETVRRRYPRAVSFIVRPVTYMEARPL